MSMAFWRRGSSTIGKDSIEKKQPIAETARRSKSEILKEFKEHLKEARKTSIDRAHGEVIAQVACREVPEGMEYHDWLCELAAVIRECGMPEYAAECYGKAKMELGIGTSNVESAIKEYEHWRGYDDKIIRGYVDEKLKSGDWKLFVELAKGFLQEDKKKIEPEIERLAGLEAECILEHRIKMEGLRVSEILHAKLREKGAMSREQMLESIEIPGLEEHRGMVLDSALGILRGEGKVATAKDGSASWRPGQFELAKI